MLAVVNSICIGHSEDGAILYLERERESTWRRVSGVSTITSHAVGLYPRLMMSEREETLGPMCDPTVDAQSSKQFSRGPVHKIKVSVM